MWLLRESAKNVRIDHAYTGARYFLFRARFMNADVLEPGFWKFSGILNVVGDNGAILIIVLELD
jgi:hypothetical protein